MPRIARKDLNTCFFHIIAQGVNREYIFKNDEYIAKYKSLLLKYSNLDNVYILAYCVMNNHVHILIYTEKNENMSSFMQHVNYQYGSYYNYKENRVGIVFRNRYLSEAIFRENYLINCIEYIHNNPVKAKVTTTPEEYKHSSSRYYSYGDKDELIRNSILGNYLNSLTNSNEEKNIFLDVDLNIDDIIESKLEEFTKEYHYTEQEIIQNTNVLKLFLNFIKSSTSIKISINKIADRLKISKNKIYSIEE